VWDLRGADPFLDIWRQPARGALTEKRNTACLARTEPHERPHSEPTRTKYPTGEKGRICMKKKKKKKKKRVFRDGMKAYGVE